MAEGTLFLFFFSDAAIARLCCKYNLQTMTHLYICINMEGIAFFLFGFFFLWFGQLGFTSEHENLLLRSQTPISEMGTVKVTFSIITSKDLIFALVLIWPLYAV